MYINSPKLLGSIFFSVVVHDAKCILDGDYLTPTSLNKYDVLVLCHHNISRSTFSAMTIILS